jgi:hypothetical protein
MDSIFLFPILIDLDLKYHQPTYETSSQSNKTEQTLCDLPTNILTDRCKVTCPSFLKGGKLKMTIFELVYAYFINLKDWDQYS